MSRLVALTFPVSAPLSALAARAHAWSVESQQRARRNAMIACTALAARRRDREEVDDFFAAREGRTSPEGSQSSVLRG